MVIQINRSNQIWDDTIMLWGSVGWMEKVEDKTTRSSRMDKFRIYKNKEKRGINSLLNSNRAEQILYILNILYYTVLRTCTPTVQNIFSFFAGWFWPDWYIFRWRRRMRARQSICWCSDILRQTEPAPEESSIWIELSAYLGWQQNTSKNYFTINKLKQKVVLIFIGFFGKMCVWWDPTFCMFCTVV